MAGVFKTAESRERIRSRYNQILGVFPFRQLYVETTHGRTFALEAGSPDSPPLVLLHGSCSNSAFWSGEISTLRGMYRVLALDIIGEAGNSDETRPDPRKDGYADWLAEALDALSVREAVIMGNSLGSWVALKFAAKYPGRVSKLILVAPSGLSKQNTAFLERAKAAEGTDGAPAWDPALAPGAGLPAEVLEFINLILQGYNPIAETLPVLTDGQLRRLTMPVLFAAGRQDVMVDAVSAAERLGRLVPRAEIHLLENTGHVVMNALEYALPFLQRHGADG